MRARQWVAFLTVLGLGLHGVSPAGADWNGEAEFAGVMEVGKWFTGADPCDKSGRAGVAGPGLWSEGVAPASRRPEGVWAIRTTFTAGGADGEDTGLFTGELSLCGRLESMIDTFGVERGASCDFSKGFEGKGRMTSGDGRLDLKLYNVGWKFTTKNQLWTTGQYQEYEQHPMKGKSGSFEGVMHITPDAGTPHDCVVGPFGEQIFDVLGVWVFENLMIDMGKPLDGPDRDKQCKADGPDNKAGPKPAVGSQFCKGPGAQK